MSWNEKARRGSFALLSAVILLASGVAVAEDEGWGPAGWRENSEDGAPAGDAADVADAAKQRAPSAVAGIHDANQDGRVTDAEADRALRRLYLIKEDSRRKGDPELIAESDANGNGRISKPEAREAIAQARPQVDPKARWADEALQLLDGNHNGTVEQGEAQQFLATLGKLGETVAGNMNKLWKAADCDRDDRIDLTEARMLSDGFGQLLLVCGTDAAASKDPAVWGRVVEVILRVDADRSHSISAAEIQAAPTFSRLFGGIDRNRNGEVTGDELYGYVNRGLQSAQKSECATCPILRADAGKKKKVIRDLVNLR